MHRILCIEFHFLFYLGILQLDIWVKIDYGVQHPVFDGFIMAKNISLIHPNKTIPFYFYNSK